MDDGILIIHPSKLYFQNKISSDLNNAVLPLTLTALNKTVVITEKAFSADESTKRP